MRVSSRAIGRTDMFARHSIAAALFAALLVCCRPAPAAAFCIENRADEALTFVVDVDGAGRNAPYVRTLAPGEEGCCDWRRYDCNSSGESDGVLQFSVSRRVGDQALTCFGDFEASDRFYFQARSGSTDCAWGLTANRSGRQLWNHFKDRMARLVAWLLDRFSS